MPRQGPRSEHTEFTRAVQRALKDRLKSSRIRTTNALSALLPISRSQLYLLLDPEGDAVLDMADLELICAAIGFEPSEIIKDAEWLCGWELREDDGGPSGTVSEIKPKGGPALPAKKAARKQHEPRPGE